MKWGVDMFSKYCVDISKEQLDAFDNLLETNCLGKHNNPTDFKKQKEETLGLLKDYLNTDVLYADILSQDWFSLKDKYDIFISHSHLDEELAIDLAEWLWETFKLKAFVDSAVWGNASDLLKEIDNKYCKNKHKSNSYNYTRRNKTTAHVHMILSVALMRMLDKCESVFFLNTSNSICSKSDMFDNSYTGSPWIYAEIQMSNSLREIKPKRDQEKQHSLMAESGQKLSVLYPVDIKDFPVINNDILEQWEWEWGWEKACGLDPITHPMDMLYRILSPQKMEPRKIIT